MFSTRSIGKFLRGKATPVQVGMSCILGSLLAFAPGFMTAPGLLISIIFLLLILNANLFLALVIAGLGKIVALLLTPVTFEVGRMLLDGPAQPVFRSAINAPVLAWFGLEYYTVSGGIAMGLVIGLVLSVIIIKVLGAFRKSMSKLEKGSSAYQRYAARRTTKIVAWVFFGSGHGKKTYDEIMARRLGLPIRPMGVVIVAVLAGGVYLARTMLSEELVRTTMQRTLVFANGATVDIESVKLDFTQGTMSVRGLAIADAADLERDLFKAGVLEAQVSTRDLLRKRMTVDLIQVSDAFSGTMRETPGVLIGRERKPEPEDTEGKTLEEYFRDAEKWYERLRQVERWLERLAKKDDETEKTDKDKTLKERLEEQILAMGYNKVRAEHLVEGSPTLLVRRVVVEGLIVEGFPGDPFDILALNISTDPSKVDEAVSLDLGARSQTLAFAFSLGEASRAGGENRLKFVRTGIDSEKFVAQLLPATLDQVTKVIAGGRLDFSLDGTFTLAGGVRLDAPLIANLRDPILMLPRPLEPTRIQNLPVTIGVRGPLSAPRLDVDTDALMRTLEASGMDVARALVENEGRKLIDGALDRSGLGDEINRALGGGAADAIGDLLGRPRRDPGQTDGQTPEGGGAERSIEDAGRDAIRDLLRPRPRPAQPREDPEKPEGGG